MNSLIILILSTLLASSTLASEFQACEDAQAAGIQVKCSNERDELSSWRNLQKIVQRLDVDDAVNAEEEFFLGVREDLKNKVRGRMNDMKIKVACIEYLNTKYHSSINTPFENAGVLPENVGKIIDACPFIVEEMRDKLVHPDESGKSSWDRMTENHVTLQTFFQRITSHSAVGLGTTTTKLKNFGISPENNTHLFNGNDPATMNFSESDRDRINTHLSDLLSRELKKRDFDTRRIPLRGSTNSTTLDSEFLSSIESLAPERRLEILKQRIENFPTSRFSTSPLSGLNYDWDKMVRKEAKQNYFEELARNPLLAHLPNGNPTDNDLKHGLNKFINQSQNFIDALTPGSEAKPLKLKHLYHFSSSIEDYLRRNPRYCAIANEWAEVRGKREKVRKLVRVVPAAVCLAGTGLTVGGAGLSATVIGAPIGAPMAAVGAPTALVGCTLSAMAGTESLYNTIQESDQNAKEVNLSDESLLAKDFSQLSALEQAEYIQKRLLPLEYLSGGIKAVPAIRGVARLRGSSPNPHAGLKFPGAAERAAQARRARQSKQFAKKFNLTITPDQRFIVLTTRVTRKLKAKGISNEEIFKALGRGNGPRNTPMSVDEYNKALLILDRKSASITQQTIKDLLAKREGHNIIKYLEEL